MSDQQSSILSTMLDNPLHLGTGVFALGYAPHLFSPSEHCQGAPLHPQRAPRPTTNDEWVLQIH
ncbi:hypothetical protein ZEAMMB73_Zm00001d042795 [Zea mays]|uniref:Uncharacterized protein n=1 Tax=Zea mays TaxID=4577 RepID=A0A1D6N6U3_MAIZE|nr:hypothetical protein ZEAMMB73_Zm00001d042795 [Zea mays]